MSGPDDASILEVMVAAAVDGHQLGEWAAVVDDDTDQVTGHQAICSACGRSVWVGVQGLIYSLLGEHCPGAAG